MKSYNTISDMYNYYCFTRDPGQATEAVTLLWNQKMDAMAALPEVDKQRKVGKLLALADAEPSQRFGSLVRSIAEGAGAPATVDDSGVLRPARVSPVLLHETPMNSLTRVLDPIGRMTDIAIEPYEKEHLVEPAVVVRVRQRMARGLLASGAHVQFEETLRKLVNESGVSVPALWRAVDWLELPMRFLVTEHMVRVLAEKANTLVKQKLPVPDALDLRTKNELKPARLLLKLLAATKPMAFPVFDDHPGLEDALAIALHQEVPEVERALAAMELNKKLTQVYAAFKERSYAAVYEVPWNANDPVELQAAIAYCCMIDYMDRWADSVAPQMENLVVEEARARWSHRLERNPHDVAALRGRANTWLVQANAAEALQDLSVAADLQPNAANLRDYAVLLGNAGRYQEAEAAATRGIACAGSDPLVTAHLYTMRADLRLQLKQPLQAWGDAVRALQLAPADGIVQKVHVATLEGAQAAWCELLPSLELAPADLVPLVRAHELMLLRRWDEADKLFAQLLLRHPELPHARECAAVIAAVRTPSRASEANAEGRLAGDLGVVAAA